MISAQHTGTPSIITHRLVSSSPTEGDEWEGEIVQANGHLRLIVDQETGQEIWRCPIEISRLW